VKKNYLAIVAAAAMTVGGIAFAQDAQPNAAQRAGNSIERGAEKTGEALKEGAEKVKETVTPNRDAESAASRNQSKHAEEIHDVMAQVAEAALTKDGLDDIVERFVDADRNRLGQNKDALKSDDTLNGRIAEFQKDWKAKYNQDFDIKDEDKVYDTSFAQITEGEEGRARTAGERIGADVNTSAGRADVNVENKTGVDAPKANTSGETAADRNLNDPGRNVATVHIAASHGKPALDVPMIHEAGGWRFDIPDSVDGPKLKQNVLNALTHCDEMKDKWPSDVNDAYRAVSHAVLLAIFDKPLMDQAASQGGTGAGTSGAPASPGATPTPTP